MLFDCRLNYHARTRASVSGYEEARNMSHVCGRIDPAEYPSRAVLQRRHGGQFGVTECHHA